MSRVLEDLLELLKLEPIEENLFRGRSQDLGFRQLFGGQVLGQALSAASRTAEPERRVHSLHGYFLRPGDASLPVVYTVDRESPWAGSGRGLSRGHIFTREGKLVASVAQEGLMRLRTDAP